MSGMRNLLPEPPATRLPVDAEASAALESVAPGAEKEVAARFPSYSDAWAALAALPPAGMRTHFPCGRQRAQLRPRRVRRRIGRWRQIRLT